MAPEYFLNRMQWWEVNHYLAGMYRRHRTAWMNTRSLQWWLACMFHDKKNGAPPQSPDALYKFAWEDDMPPITEDDADYLEQLCKEYREQNKKSKKKQKAAK